MGDQAVPGNHLDIVGAATAHPGVGHRDERYAMRRALLDRRLRRAIKRKHPDVVATVKGDRDSGLAQHRHRPPRRGEVLALGQVENLCQTRVFITAQRRVDDVVGDDARLLVAVANAAQRPFGQIACVRDAEAQTAAPNRRRHGQRLRTLDRMQTLRCGEVALFPALAAQLLLTPARGQAGHPRMIARGRKRGPRHCPCNAPQTVG